jgi:outer membrane usher protein FimD/PapC
MEILASGSSIPYGKYEIEIYINDQLIETKNFEVVKSEISLSNFEKNNK